MRAFTNHRTQKMHIDSVSVSVAGVWTQIQPNAPKENDRATCGL